MIQRRLKRVLALLLSASMTVSTNMVPAFAASPELAFISNGTENVTGSAIEEGDTEENQKEPEKKQEEPEKQEESEKQEEPVDQASEEMPLEQEARQGIRVIETASGSFTVSGGALVAYNATGSAIVVPDVKIPDGEGITEIGENVFKGNTDITAVSMPNTITKIGKSAFEHATSLKDINFSTALTELGERAFYSCSSLLSVNLSKTSLEKIGDSAFYSCTKIVLVNFPDVSLKSIGNLAFNGCTAIIGIDFPDSITEIGEYAFKNCIKLESIKLPSKLSTLGKGAFYSCTAAKSLSIPSSLKVIPENAFWGCTRLVDLEVKRGVTTIGAGAFNSCTSLSFADFPNTITEIQEEAFANCTMLRVLIIRGDVEKVGIDAFRGTNINLTVYGYINDKTLREAVTNVSMRKFIDLENRSDNKKLKLWNLFTSSNKDKYHGQITAYYVEEEEKKGSDDKPVYDEDGNVKKVEKKYTITDSTNLQSGKKIYLKVSPSKDYRLAEGSLRYNGKEIKNVVSGHDKENNSDLVELDGYYYFTMPNFNTVITAEFERGKDESGIDGTGIELLNNGDLTLESEGSVPVYSMKKTQKIKLVMLDSTYGTKIPNNKLIYSVYSSETKRSNDYVEIDEYGNLTAKKATPSSSAGTNIYAWVRGYKESTKINFKLKIYGTTVERVEFDLSDGESYGLVSDSSDIIVFNKADVNADKKILFEAVANGIDKDGDILNVEYDWSVIDDKVAKVSDTKSNKNTISIVGEGTTVVKATTSVKVGSSTKKIEGHFTIQVVDTKPKCNVDSITVNPYLKNGAEISIIPFEGYEIRKDDKYGVNIYEENGNDTDKFELITTKGNQCYIKATDPLQKAGTYKMSIRGYYKKLTEEGYSGTDAFNYKIKVTVKRSLPGVSLSLKGTKIDAFYTKEKYNGRKTEDLIQVADNLKSDKISEYEFIPMESSDSEKQEGYNHFATYFDIEEINGKKYLKQKKDFAYDEKGNVLGLTGYIRVWFDGYEKYMDDDCKTYKDIKVTFPVNKNVPGYVLSSKKGSVNSRYTGVNGQLIALKLYNSTKEKKVIDFTSDAKLLQEEGASKVALIGTLNDKNSGSYIDPATDTIYLRVAARDKLDGGKITFGISDSGWNRPINFSYSLSVTDKTPKASFSPASVTLNTLSPDLKTPVELSLNQIAEGILNDTQTVVFTPSNSASKAAYNEYGRMLEEILNSSYQAENHSFEAMLPSGVSPVTGSYKFKCIVNEGSSDVLNTIALTVKVAQKPAQINGLTGTYSLNSSAKGEVSFKEKDYVKYVKNMPEGYYVGGTPEVIGANANSMNAVDKFDFTITTGSAVRLNISIRENANASGTYKFKIIPKMISATNPAGSNMKEFTVSVKVYSKSNSEMTATLKKKSGSMNPIDRENGMYYTVSFKNILDTPKAGEVTVREGSAVSERFKASYDPETALVHLQMIPGAEISTKISYNLVLGFELENTGLTVYTKNIKMKPAMVKPKLTIDSEEMKLYKSNTDVVQSIKIKEEELKTEVVPEISDIQLAGDPKKNTYLNGFSVAYDKAANAVLVSLKKEQSGYLVSGQVYSLKCNVIYKDNPMTKGKDGKTTYDVGSTITIKIKVSN